MTVTSVFPAIDVCQSGNRFLEQWIFHFRLSHSKEKQQNSHSPAIKPVEVWLLSTLHGFAKNFYHAGYVSQESAYCHVIPLHEWHVLSYLKLRVFILIMKQQRFESQLQGINKQAPLFSITFLTDDFHERESTLPQHTKLPSRTKTAEHLF